MGTAYQNEYDENGRLLSSTATSYGSGNSSNPAPSKTAFHEDAAGRCDLVESTVDGVNSSREARMYDASDHLVRVEGTRSSSYCPSWVSTLTYDDQGRILTSSTACEGAAAMDLGTTTKTIVYNADGTEEIELYDGTTDVVSERRKEIHRSAGCAAMDANIGGPTDQRCRAL